MPLTFQEFRILHNAVISFGQFSYQPAEEDISAADSLYARGFLQAANGWPAVTIATDEGERAHDEIWYCAERIDVLRDEAASAGDSEQVRLCELALSAHSPSILACIKVLLDAEAANA